MHTFVDVRYLSLGWHDGMGWVGERDHRACEDEQGQWIGGKNERDQAGDERMGLWGAFDVRD